MIKVSSGKWLDHIRLLGTQRCRTCHQRSNTSVKLSLPLWSTWTGPIKMKPSIYSPVLCAFVVILSGLTDSLPVPKYPRAISSLNSKYNRFFGKVKPSPDILFEPEPDKNTHNFGSDPNNRGSPLIDIYNDRIFFREPAPNSGYIRSFPSTTPRSAGFRRRFEGEFLAGMLPTVETEPSEPKISSPSSVSTPGTTEGLRVPSAADQVPLAWLQEWVRQNNYTILPEADPSSRPSTEPPLNESDEVKIAFQSLFQVPTVKKPCPPNQRRTHHGKCVRPLRIRLTIIEEDVVPAT